MVDAAEVGLQPLEYEDFTLVLGASEPGRLQISVESAPAGVEIQPGAVTVPFEAASLQVPTQESLDAAPSGDALVSLGLRLAELALPAPVRTWFEQSWAVVRSRGKGIRLRVRTDPSRTPELVGVAWEYLALPGEAGQSGPRFLGLEDSVSVVRSDVTQREPGELQPLQRASLVGVLSSPPIKTWPALNTDAERQSILDAIGGARGRFDFTWIEPGDPDQPGHLDQAVNARSVNILHYFGHAGRRDDKWMLALEQVDSRTGTRAIFGYDAERLVDLLKRADVRLVVLNGCKTGQRDAAYRWGGLGPALTQLNIPAVIGNQFEINPDDAQLITRVLYQRLLAGYSPDQAVSEVRRALSRDRGGPLSGLWGLPVLYLQGRGDPLIPRTRALAPETLTLLKRLTAAGPKRILAIDGGGIRSVITLGVLERLEQVLRTRHNKPDLKLCDYFDLIGGTSSSAVLAAGLAIGKDVAEVKQLYLQIASRAFGQRAWKRWVARFDSDALAQELERAFGDRTLDDTAIRTGLCIIAKRADTRSTWPLINHPDGKYYQDNRHILLRRAIRGSMASPAYFVPEQFAVKDDEMGVFVDAEISMARDPALQLFLVATLRGFRLQWRVGEDNLLLVSVGTGIWRPRDNPDTVLDSRSWDWTREIPLMLMDDAARQTRLLLQYLSRTQTPWPIDREMGDLADDLLGPTPALTYLRYDARLDEQGLQDLGLADLAPKVVSLRDPSEAHNADQLARIGHAAAELILDSHFPRVFDLPQ